jgi:hypothetical protein
MTKDGKELRMKTICRTANLLGHNEFKCFTVFDQCCTITQSLMPYAR